MKKYSKKISALVLALSCSISVLAGCGTTDEAEKSSVAAATTQSTASETTQKEGPSWKWDTTPVTLDWFINISWYDKKWDLKQDMYKYITDKTGMSFNIQVPPSDSSEKLSTMIASNELPDIITTDLFTQQNNVLIKGQKLYSLNELIDKYSPTFKEIIPKSMIDFSTAKYGDFNFMISYFYAPERQKEGDKYTTKNSVMVRKDMMEQLGLKEEDFSTTDKFIETLKKVRDAKLTYKGNKVTPLYFNESGGTTDNLILTLPAMFGIRNVDENGNYIETFKNPRYMEVLKFANTLYKEGLLSVDNFTAQMKQVEEKLTQGSVFAYVGQPANYVTAVKTLAVNDPNAVYLGLDAVKASGYKPIYTQDSGGWTTTAITKNCKNPERAVRFLEYLYSDEGQMDTVYGELNKHYAIGTDGKAVNTQYVTDAQKQDIDAGYKFMGINSIYWATDPFYALRFAPKPTNAPDIIWDQINYSQSKYIVNTNAFINVEPVSGTDLGIKGASILQYWQKQLPKMILAKSDEGLTKIYNDTIERMNKMGQTEIQKYMDEKYKENMKSYGLKDAYNGK